MPSTSISFLPFAFEAFFLFGISLTAAAAEREDAHAAGTSSTADTQTAETNEEGRDDSQENPEVDPRLAPVVHTVGHEVQAAHAGVDASPTRDGAEDGGEVVVIPGRNGRLLVIFIIGN